MNSSDDEEEEAGTSNDHDVPAMTPGNVGPSREDSGFASQNSVPNLQSLISSLINDIGGNPHLQIVPPNHEFVVVDRLTGTEVENADPLSVQGNSKRVRRYPDGEEFVTRSTVTEVLMTMFDPDSLKYIFKLQHPNLLRNFNFVRSDEPSSKITAVESEEALSTFEYECINGVIPNRTGLQWVVNFLQPITFLHSENIVHGRIAPWRVFFDMADVVKLHLVPFRMIPLDRNQTFTADELRNRPYPSKEGDVYAAASVIYYVLEGREPPLDKTGLHISNVSDDTNRLLAQSWSANPTERPLVEREKMDDDERLIQKLQGELKDLDVRRFETQQEKTALERQLTTGKLAVIPAQTQRHPWRNQQDDESKSDWLQQVSEREMFTPEHIQEMSTFYERIHEFFTVPKNASPERQEEQIEFSPTLRRYTGEKIGLAEDKLKISQLPYNVGTYFFGKIRLVSVHEDYIPYIPELYHKNIVAQYGLLLSKNNGYFLMLETTVGTSVEEYLKENKPTEDTTLSWLLDVSRAMHYLHSLNFYYGNLSFDRMLIHGSGVKLEHPAVCENYGQGVKQDLLELCKLVQTSTDKRLQSLSEKIENQTIQNVKEICRYLEELVPKSLFFKGAKSLKRMAPSEDVISSKVAKRPRTVLTFDPDVQIVPEDVEDIDGQKETSIGTLVELETDHVNGQGHYVSASIKLDGYMGPALVKYLGGRSELWHQARDYTNLGITNPAVAEAFELASCFKNSEREIRFAGKLCHPNIVKVLAYISPDCTRDNINGIIMEGAPQGTLDTYAAGNPISNEQYKSFSQQLASALKYCHTVQGIIHRDIRPENIYVYDEETLKLGNFGYARINDEGNPMTATKGENIFYCAPEMISTGPLADYGFSADVYSYGMTLWSMCHKGSKPFKDELKRSYRAFRDYLEKGNRPMLRAELPASMTVLIPKCWITESEVRPTFTDIVRQLQQL